MIRQATVADSAPVCEIYNHYVLETVITFEEQAVTVEDMAQSVLEHSAKPPLAIFEQYRVMLDDAVI